jgi:hypothetical protein
LESCLRRPISKNSVFEALSLQHPRRDFSKRVFDKRNIFKEVGSRERNEKLSVITIQMVMNWRFRHDGVPGVVYTINRRGRRTEPMDIYLGLN